MPSIKLYMANYSPPARACTWILYANGITDKVELVFTNVYEGDHLKPEYLALNPYHSIPTLHDEENGIILKESCAIIEYLVEKFDLKEIGIPTDFVGRYKFREYLGFHGDKISSVIKNIVVPLAAPLRSEQPIDQELIKTNVKKMEDWLGALDSQVKMNGGYLISDKPTVADLYCYSYFAYLYDNFFGTGLYRFTKYSNLQAWAEKTRAIKGWEQCAAGSEAMAGALKASLPEGFKLEE